MYSIAVIINVNELNNFIRGSYISILKNINTQYNIKYYIHIDPKNKKALTELINKKKYNNVFYEIITSNLCSNAEIYNFLSLKAYQNKTHDFLFLIQDDLIINNKSNLFESYINSIKKSMYINKGTNDLFLSIVHFEKYGFLLPDNIEFKEIYEWLNKIYGCSNTITGIEINCINEIGDQQTHNVFNNKNTVLKKQKPILIIGNGKSTQQIDWDWLKTNSNKIDTFGINSAYKMYDKLGFYPTYYANLDSVVIKSHKDKLQELLNKKIIKKCFYLSNVNFEENETYYKIHKVFPGWSGISSNIHKFHSWANTGSDCVQLAIMMGYTDIYIIGIDGYVEKIKQSKLTKNNTLIITETPKDNPNYWFDDYQSKGDEYNIPNASQWHVPGWDYTNKICNYCNINIKNLSTTKDYVKSIPFLDFSNFVDDINNL